MERRWGGLGFAASLLREKGPDGCGKMAWSPENVEGDEEEEEEEEDGEGEEDLGDEDGDRGGHGGVWLVVVGLGAGWP